MLDVILVTLLERDKHLIFINEHAVRHIVTLVEWLHAVNELSFWCHTALVQPIGSGDEDNLRLALGSHSKDFNAPSVFNWAKGLRTDLWNSILLKIYHGEEAFYMATNDEGVV